MKRATVPPQQPVNSFGESRAGAARVLDQNEFRTAWSKNVHKFNGSDTIPGRRDNDAALDEFARIVLVIHKDVSTLSFEAPQETRFAQHVLYIITAAARSLRRSLVCE